jgi:hypothetical protein
MRVYAFYAWWLMCRSYAVRNVPKLASGQNSAHDAAVRVQMTSWCSFLSFF